MKIIIFHLLLILKIINFLNMNFQLLKKKKMKNYQKKKEMNIKMIFLYFILKEMKIIISKIYSVVKKE